MMVNFKTYYVAVKVIVARRPIFFVYLPLCCVCQITVSLKISL